MISIYIYTHTHYIYIYICTCTHTHIFTEYKLREEIGALLVRQTVNRMCSDNAMYSLCVSYWNVFLMCSLLEYVLLIECVLLMECAPLK